MGFLFIGPAETARIAEIIEHASKPENVWLADGVPIDHDAHSVVLGSYVAKFTLTRNADGVLYRYVSVACVLPGRVPSVILVIEIGQAFGMRDPYKFDGWAMAECDCGCKALQVLQRVDPPPPGWQSPAGCVQ